MTGYVRVDTSNNIADGNIISAADLDGEFDGVQSAFNANSGHTHGGAIGEGAPITKIGPSNDVTASTTVLAPKTTATVSLGTSSLKFKDLHLSGDAVIAGVVTAVLTSSTGLPIVAGTTGTLSVGRGGTGSTTLTLNNVLLGNGTDALQAVAPGTSGNLLTSNGTTWTSSPPAAASFPAAGIAVSTGTAWDTSKATPTGVIVGDTDTQTLTNKTLGGVVLNDGYTEEVFAVTGTTPALSPTNGSIQTWTLSASSTPTAGTWAAGQSMTLMVNDSSSSYTVTWTSLPVVWVGGTAPTLAPSSGYTIIVLWKVGTTIYGALTGQVV